MAGSLHTRQLIAASLILAGFFTLTGLTLNQAFRAGIEDAMRERLRGQIYALLGTVDEDASGLIRLPELLPDPRFNQPDSGNYAQVVGVSLDWRSPSMVGWSNSFLQTMKPGEQQLRSVRTVEGGAVNALSFGVVWEAEDGGERSYTFAVAESTRGMERQMAVFSHTLWSWLGGAAVLLLVAQGLVLRWSLKPLRRAVLELKAIEAGQAERLIGAYPRELSALTESINSLIRHAQARQTRFRNSLGDLAHSMKTPLAILQGLVDGQAAQSSEWRQPLQEQLQRMNHIVHQQLQRAASSGAGRFSGRTLVRPVVERICRSLEKVYRDKPIRLHLEVPQSVSFKGDEGDLMEWLGNLLENAWKYCRGEVRVVAHMDDVAAWSLVIDDDGAGIPAHQVEQVLRRGVRADQTRPGHGIGLSVADEIIRLYGGTLRIETSPLGGARIKVSFAAP